MNSFETIKIAKFVNERMKVHRLAFPFLAALLAAVAMMFFEASSASKNSQSLLKTLVPHVAVLIETNDLLELQRFVAMISRESGSTIDIVRDGKIVASSRSRERIGLPEQTSASESIFPSFNSGSLITTVEVRRSDGPSLNCTMSRYVSLWSLAGTITAIFASTLIGGFSISYALASRMTKEFSDCLTPIQELANAVETLATNEETTINAVGIQELDAVANAINRTRLQLYERTRELSESRANEIANESMRQLLHDLHTPITALRQMAKIADSERHSSQLRDSARKDIVDLAEQLVGQIAAGKQNLGMRITLKPNLDLNETMLKIASRLKPVVAEKNVALIQRISSEQAMCAHDPVMLERAISNLVVNAAEASATLVEISVDTVDCTPRIRVSDNGPGMSPQDVSLHLKGRGRSSKSDRNGIGLSNSNIIARGHGTKLVFRRSRHGGSEFEIRLPRELETDVL